MVGRVPARRWRVHLSGRLTVLREFLQRFPPGCEHVQRAPDGLHGHIELSLDERQLAFARHLGLPHKILYDATAREREQTAWVGRGNRFSDGRIPAGVGVPKVKGSP